MERGHSGSHNQGRSKSRSKKNAKCHYCRKKGHLKKNCCSVKKIEKAKGIGPDPSKAQGCIASTSDDGGILYSKATTVVEGIRQFSYV